MKIVRSLAASAVGSVMMATGALAVDAAPAATVTILAETTQSAPRFYADLSFLWMQRGDPAQTAILTDWLDYDDIVLGAAEFEIQGRDAEVAELDVV